MISCLLLSTSHRCETTVFIKRPSLGDLAMVCRGVFTDEGNGFIKDLSSNSLFVCTVTELIRLCLHVVEVANLQETISKTEPLLANLQQPFGVVTDQISGDGSACCNSPSPGRKLLSRMAAFAFRSCEGGVSA